MSFFKKNKDSQPTSETNEEIKFGKRAEHTDKKPDVLTPEEVLNLGKTTQETAHSALESLRKKLTKMESEEQSVETPETKETIVEETEITETEPTSTVNLELDDMVVSDDTVKTETVKTEPETSQKTSLVDRCSPYFVDNEGKDITDNQKPFYRLESVADILEEYTKKQIKRLSEQYGISPDEISIPSVVSNEMEITEEPELPAEEPPKEETAPVTEKADGDTKNPGAACAASGF